MHSRLSIDTARELLDFSAGASAGVVSAAVAEEQLAGAVALHNMLQDQNVAYLADEVGMGKTYVALGAMALLRHFRPELRVMVLAPKENIQNKWMKEWRNFVSRVVRIEDLRVKGLGGHPARALVKVNSLVDLVTEASNDPDRDYFVRLTSFSLPVSGADGALSKRKAQLLRAVPWLSPDLIDARNKDRYKRNFGRAVNCALPDIDLLIVDEAHNLKAGWSDGSSASVRNTVLGCALGGRSVEADAASFRGYGRRVKKVLFLSATPIEYDIRQLWNQLDLFGFSGSFGGLANKKLSHEEHREIVRGLLIRRTAEISAGQAKLTKSQYRREWRGGGIATHDDPLALASDRQRLAVALVQKKVSEVLGSGQSGHSFQVGMLASFESFLETAKVASEAIGSISNEFEENEDDALFHRSREEIAADQGARRDGADIDAINNLARSHRNTFGTEMPHPKMDAIVDELAKSFSTARKALVFVRRVASVDELQRKLEEKYDQQLFTRLRRGLASPELRTEMDRQIAAYEAERREARHRIRARDDANRLPSEDGEQSSVDSFFAWFFRGRGPDGVRSGASIALDLEKASSAYSTLLEDNYVAAVLSVPTAQVIPRMAELLGFDQSALLALVGTEAARHLGRRTTAVRSRERMRAFQAAALSLLSTLPGQVGAAASVTLQEVFIAPVQELRPSRREEGAERWLSESTLFSELRERTALRHHLWPQPTELNPRLALRESEIRRELLSSMIRKGHAIIDVFLLIANRLGSIRRGVRERAQDELPDIASAVLDELARQRDEEAGQFNAYSELAEAAAAFHLIMQLNAPELHEAELSRVPTILGRTLRAQRPIAGMAGQVNGEVVRQFRMPGYPLVLITTDLLKEGEDLHTFCSNVYHYGIAWMPSELEQRVGRVDRVGSQTERRLGSADSMREDDLLQVYYPHLTDTVEVLQLRRVYERLNRFMRMMHEGLGMPAKERADIDVSVEGMRSQMDVQAIRSPLRSAFRVTAEMLEGDSVPLASTASAAARLRERFGILQTLLSSWGARDVHSKDVHHITGEFQLGSRVQPFTLLLRSLRGRAVVRCVSPVGLVNTAQWDDRTASRLLSAPFVRLSLEHDDRFDAYNVAIEGDVVLGSADLDAMRTRALIDAVITTADRIEQSLLFGDLRIVDVLPELQTEMDVAR